MYSRPSPVFVKNAWLTFPLSSRYIAPGGPVAPRPPPRSRGAAHPVPCRFSSILLTDPLDAMVARTHLVPLTLCLAMLVGVGVAPVQAQDEASAIRVRLFDDDRADQVTLSAVKGTLRLTTGADANTLARLDAGEQATLGTRSGEVYVRLGQGGLYAKALHVQPTSETARWSIAPQDGRPRTYAGSLAVRADSARPDILQLVNAVPLEDYVASVVASEYTLDDTEGMKAMAVVARTYALRA
ncbi:MAG: hypothetical protein GVY35_05615, partial [Bacteroidetes bacterium]|nr:hypothetical protein [Bacteroidota bacterium]